jgi:mitochondrial chaperone BCS1
LIHCLAGELGLDVYVISLSRTGMDDSALDQLVNELPERCVALMEDIDAAFTSSLNRDQDNSSTTAPNAPSSSTSDGKPAKPDGPAPPPPNNRLSLSGLLNALDGIGAQEGRILFATTNHYRSLDPALCRPGRMDLHIEFKLASKYQAKELFTRFYLPGDHPDEEEEDKEKVKKEDNEKVDDSGYTSNADTSSETSSEKGAEGVSDTAAADGTAGDDKGKGEGTATLENEKPHVIGHRHSHGPVMSPKQVKELAAQFAEAIPEREVSMASLQGFLMSYKVRPFQAVKDAPEWVIKERKEKEEKEKERMAKAEKEKKEAEEKAAKEAKEKKEAEEKEKKEKEEKEKKEKEGTSS